MLKTQGKKEDNFALKLTEINGKLQLQNKKIKIYNK